jgi:transcriptional regulator with GAF, ATPase, and Fis domain
MKTLNLKEDVRISTVSNFSVNPQVHEKQFDEFTTLIANLCGVKRACITLIEKEKLWFKSNIGMPYNYVQFKRSYCQFTAFNGELTQFSNTETDPRLAHSSWTQDYPHIRFYAGIPLVTSDGVVGTLCIMDEKPQVLTSHQKEMLTSLGAMVSSLMESRINKSMVKTEAPKKSATHPTLSLRSARFTSRSW